MAEGLLEVSNRIEDSGTTLSVAGELDLNSLPVFLAAFNEALGSHVDVVTIDTEDLTFADSSALRGLLEAQSAADSLGVVLRLVHVSGSLGRALELAGIEDVFDITDV